MSDIHFNIPKQNREYLENVVNDEVALDLSTLINKIIIDFIKKDKIKKNKCK